MDAMNGFQEIKRSSMHRAVLRRCPSLLSLFKKYYTKESLCFFNMDSEVRLLKAHEGARIGCKLSSFGFALTVQDLYETIAKRLADPVSKLPLTMSFLFSKLRIRKNSVRILLMSVVSWTKVLRM